MQREEQYLKKSHPNREKYHQSVFVANVQHDFLRIVSMRRDTVISVVWPLNKEGKLVGGGEPLHGH